MKIEILAIFLCCAGALLAIPAPKEKKIFDINEKFGVLALSTLKPSQFGEISWNSLFAEEDLPYIDYFFIDVRSLLTQSKKVEPVNFPELDWTHRQEWCIPTCYYWYFTLKTGNTTMTGQKQTTSVNEITPTTFRNVFTTPSFVGESPDFIFEVKDGPTDTRIVWRNFRLSINNLKFDTTFNYEFVQELGIQISNLDIKFSISHLRTTIWDVKQYMSKDEENFIPYPPLFTDWTLPLLGDWVNHKQEYLGSLESRINCVLSESRIDQEGCGNKTSEFANLYQKMSVIQLFETIGLGSLER